MQQLDSFEKTRCDLESISFKMDASIPEHSSGASGGEVRRTEEEDFCWRYDPEPGFVASHTASFAQWAPFFDTPCPWEVDSYLCNTVEEALTDDSPLDGLDGEGPVHVSPQLWVGVRDSDDPQNDRLSPMLKVEFLMDGEWYIDENRLGGIQYSSTSPVRLLEDTWRAAHARFVSTTFRIQGLHYRTGEEQYGTSFAVSSTVALTARHVLRDVEGNNISHLLGLHQPAREVNFARGDRPMFFLCPLAEHFQDSFVDLKDPITSNVVTDALGLDVAAIGLVEPFLSKKDKPIRRFSEFLVPMCLSVEGLDINNLPAHHLFNYPMVNQVRKDVMAAKNRSSTREERAALFFRNIGMLSKEVIAELKGEQMTWSQFSKQNASAKVLTLKWMDEVYSKLLELTDGIYDGDLVLSTGRILNSNGSLIAHSASTFCGSSGAPVTSIVATAGCFVGVHFGPGQRSADSFQRPTYNLAVNCEDKEFGLLYCYQVLPTLPLPWSSIWEKDMERKGVLLRFLAFHLPHVVDVLDSWMVPVVEGVASSWPTKPRGLFPSTDVHELVTDELLMLIGGCGTLRYGEGGGIFEDPSFRNKVNGPFSMDCWGLDYKAKDSFEVLRLASCLSRFGRRCKCHPVEKTRSS